MDYFALLVLAALEVGINSTRDPIRAIDAVSFAYVAAGYSLEDADQFFDNLIRHPRYEWMSESDRRVIYKKWVLCQLRHWGMTDAGKLVPGKLRNRVVLAALDAVHNGTNLEPTNPKAKRAAGCC
jgi:hypothetical protein